MAALVGSLAGCGTSSLADPSPPSPAKVGKVATHTGSGVPARTTPSPVADRDSEVAEAYASTSRSQVEHRRAAAPQHVQVRRSTVSATTGVSPGAPSDAEIREELEQLQGIQRQERRERVPRGKDTVTSGGNARIPVGLPQAVARVLAAGNAIARYPYVYGGGHRSFVDSAYDCSGSVSYALAAAGFLDRPLTSGELAHSGAPGRGRYITIYANAGHTFMYVDGLRFDTSGRAGPRGSRWQTAPRSLNGFVVRHPPGY